MADSATTPWAWDDDGWIRITQKCRIGSTTLSPGVRLHPTVRFGDIPLWVFAKSKLQVAHVGDTLYVKGYYRGAR